MEHADPCRGRVKSLAKSMPTVMWKMENVPSELRLSWAKEISRQNAKWPLLSCLRWKGAEAEELAKESFSLKSELRVNIN